MILSCKCPSRHLHLECGGFLSFHHDRCKLLCIHIFLRTDRHELYAQTTVISMNVIHHSYADIKPSNNERRPTHAVPPLAICYPSNYCAPLHSRHPSQQSCGLPVLIAPPESGGLSQHAAGAHKQQLRCVLFSILPQRILFLQIQLDLEQCPIYKTRSLVKTNDLAPPSTAVIFLS